MRESKGNEMLQAQVCALQEQIEPKLVLHTESIKSLLEKNFALEIMKREAQLKAQQYKRLAHNIDEYHKAEIKMLDEALEEKTIVISQCHEETISCLNYISELLDDIQWYEERDVERITQSGFETKRVSIDMGIQTEDICQHP